MQFPNGGWFTSLTVQVRNGSVWSDVAGLLSTPAYSGANGTNYETFTLTFTPVAGDGIRIGGVPGGSAHYISVGELRVLDNGTTSVGPDPGIPQDYALRQNFPNPFNPGTNITFDLPVDAHVTLKVFDITGREVATLADGIARAGRQTVTFVPADLSSGVYFYRLSANGFVETKRMVLIR
jgi:hypothetical protein